MEWLGVTIFITCKNNIFCSTMHRSTTFFGSRVCVTEWTRLATSMLLELGRFATKCEQPH
eukprot:2737252-Amphidinium_carterae.3